MGIVRRIFVRLATSKTNLSGMTFSEQGRLLKAMERSRNLDIPIDDDTLLVKEAIVDLERAAVANPNEWVYFYALADYYNRLTAYAKALTASEKALALRPNDARTTYALATVYRILARARYTETETLQRFHAMLSLGQLDRDFNPIASQIELQRTGLTVEEVLERGISLFRQTQAFFLTDDERAHVAGNIADMEDDLVKVRAARTIAEASD